MKVAKVSAAVLGGAVAIGAGAAAIGWTIARRLTAPVSGRRFNLTVRDIEHDTGITKIVLDRTHETTAHGIYNLWFAHGGWAQLGADIEDRGSDGVARSITGTSPGLTPAPGDKVSWSGIYFATPADAGLAVTEISIHTEAGPCPAWRINGTTSTWAIHIHGLGSTLAGTLRGVQVATELGYTSLIVSYRNDGEGPTVGSGRSTLGADETLDVEEAIHYAIRRGAERIVLFGWSMGGAIAVLLASKPDLAPHIAALVLDSPVLDWQDVIRANCVRAGLPGFLGLFAEPWLSSPALARLVGLPHAIPSEKTRYRSRAENHRVPTWILHGARDDSVPLTMSTTFRNLRPDLVTLHTFSAGHTLSWNVDPKRWRDSVKTWLARQHESG
ncbi:alpha/beta hydrolase [Microbacterium aerolatum]|uniref:alpha/beta hydrolase n=1 Tax=Microbacterium aerolatum TaxID=153731 RepID=UPI002000989C|nr:alpha/beta fold hydrolase [Microbacterium aerolatum]MCK3771196.1 alpha/beta hydrolase [Microbacterium aerolatum]